MGSSTYLLPALGIIACVTTGVLLVRRAWRRPMGQGAAEKWGGWALIFAAFIWPAWLLGSVRGPFFGLTMASAVALTIIAIGYERRQARSRVARESLAPEPSERPTTIWREALRWSLAGPIGMVAAMAVGIAYAALASGEQQTRLVVGGLIVPLVWGGAMAWTLSDDRILRATAVLVGVSILGFGSAILVGFS